MATEDSQLELIKLIMQLAELERRIKPILPGASKKLVKDLIDSGCKPARLGKAIGRSPSYMLAISNGAKSLSAADFVRLVKHAVTSGHQNADK